MTNKQPKNIQEKWKLLKTIRGWLSGRFNSNKHWTGGAVFSKQAYFVPGRDPISSIDWKTICQARPQSKFQERKRNTDTYFLVDISRSMLFSSNPHRNKKDIAEILLSLAWASVNDGNNVTIIGFNKRKAIELKRSLNPSQCVNTIQQIMDYSPETAEEARGTNLGSALNELANNGTADSVIFIISDFLTDNNYGKALARLKSRNVIAAISIEDGADRLAKKRGVYFAVRGLENGRIKHIKFAEKKQEHTGIFKELNIRHLEFDTGDSDEKIVKKIISYFRNRRL